MIRKLQQYKDALLAVLSRGIGLVLQFGMNVVLGWQLGAAGMGIYSLYTSWMMMLSGIIEMGMTNYTLRTVSVLDSKGARNTACGFSLRVLRLLLLTGAVMLVIVLLLPETVVVWLLGKSSLQSVLLLAAIAAVLFICIRILSETLKGMRRVNTALIADTVLLPIGVLLIVGLFLYNQWVLPAENFLLIHLALSLLTVTVMLWLLARMRSPEMDNAAVSAPPLLSRSLLPFWGSGLLNMWFMNMPILLLPHFADTHEIGVFGVAYRLIAMGTLILATLASVFGPKFARDYANNDAAELKRGLRQSQLFSLLLYSPLLIAFTLFAEPVLAIFGDEFRAGKELLWIMVAGQVLNTATGLVGFMMNMIHREKQEFYIQLSVTLLMFVLIIVLGKEYGVTGVAIAYASGIVVKNITSFLFSHYYLRIMAKQQGASI